MGYYESRTGSKRRSRKGRTSIVPNGYAYYCATVEEYQSVGLCGGRPPITRNVTKEKETWWKR